jgi:hypothetical protein
MFAVELKLVFTLGFGLWKLGFIERYPRSIGAATLLPHSVQEPS